MTDLQIYAQENKYGVRGIESGAAGLKYIMDSERRGRELSAIEIPGSGGRNHERGTPEYGAGERWPAEPRLGGMADGLPRWLDEPLTVPRIARGVKDRVGRLKCLGNAVVPQQFYPIFRAIAEIERGEIS